MKGKDEIEKLFQKELGNYQAKVNPNLWSGVQAGLGSSAAATGIGASIGIVGKIAIGVVAAVGITIGTIVLVNNKKTPSTKKQQITQTIPPQKSTSPNRENESQQITSSSKSTNNEAFPLVKKPINKKDNLAKVKGKKGTIKVAKQAHPSINVSSTVPLSNGETTKKSIKHSPKMTYVPPIIKKEEKQPDKALTKSNDNAVLTNVWAGISNQKNQYVHFSSRGVPKEASIEWDFGDGNIDYTAQPDHFYSSTGDYTVVFTVHNGKEKVTKKIPVHVEVSGKIDDLPNVFTPNGDGNNDVLYIHSENIKSFQITIMDLNQNVVYSSTDPYFRWKGLNKAGQPVKEGRYIYSIVAKDNNGNVINKYQQLTIRR